MTHGPPAGTLDRIEDGMSVGCVDLATRVASIRPRLHVFGHIHEGHGAEVKRWEEDIPPPSPDYPSFMVPASPGAPGSSPYSRSASPSLSRDDISVRSGRSRSGSVHSHMSTASVSSTSSSRSSSSHSSKFSVSSRDSMTSYAGSDFGVEAPEAPWRKETICVNAANTPLGPKAKDATGAQIGIGGIGWQPVIVDLDPYDSPDDVALGSLATQFGRMNVRP